MSDSQDRKMDFYGQSVSIVGKDIEIGEQAPEFIAQTTDWTMINVLNSTRGKTRIIGSLPSLNTPVCDKEIRRFNHMIDRLREDVVIVMISMDLPWTQKNWCTAARVDRIMVLSDHINADFGIKYGTLLEEPRILRRATFVVRADNQVVYAEYAPELGIEPDYETVRQVAQESTTVP